MHFIDNWSSDETLERAEGHRAVWLPSAFPSGRPRHYEWERIIERGSRRSPPLPKPTGWSTTMPTSGGQSPWPGVPMVDALYWVAAPATTRSITPWWCTRQPTTDSRRVTDVTGALRYFEFGRRPGHFTQIKAWRPGVGGWTWPPQGDTRRLSGGGGCSRSISCYGTTRSGRRPTGAQGPRGTTTPLVAGERRRGWHNQYDTADGDTVFIRDPGELNLFAEATFHNVTCSSGSRESGSER